jgi:nitrogen fixation protein NifB
VNRAVKSRGAFLHNIMPLISAAEHGTFFGLTGQRGPTAQELKAVQDACAGGANLMRHCRQCRADAVGLLGEDRSDEFTADRVETLEVHDDPARRIAWREQVEVQRAAHQAARKAAVAASDATTREAAAAVAADPLDDLKVLVAVATKGQGLINQHFGHASELQIYEVDAQGATFVGHRRIDLYCQGGWGEDEMLPSIVKAINDCHAVLVAKVGACPRDELAAAGIAPVDAYAHDFIEQGAMAWFRGYVADVRAGAVVHVPRTGAAHDAALRQGALTAPATPEAPVARAA